jgi:hypothetical protein
LTTSGTYSFISNFSIVEIIDEAFRRIQIDPGSLTGDQLKSASISLNLLFIEWINDGVEQFITETETHLLVVGDESFTTPEATVDVFNMVFRQNDQDIQIKPISRQDYLYINQKDVPGQPVCYFTDKTTLPPVVKLWPVPNVASTYVVYNRLRQMQDVGAFTNTPDTTYFYVEAMVSGLAAKLSEKYSTPPMMADKLVRYQMAYRNAKNADRDRSPYVMKPRLGRRYLYGV